MCDLICRLNAQLNIYVFDITNDISKLNFKIVSTDIEIVKSGNYSGIIINRDRNFKEHIKTT